MGTRSILIFDNKPDGWITIEFAANNLLIRVQSLQLKRSSALQPNLHVCSSLYRQCHSRSKQFDLARDLSRGEPGFRWSAPLHNAGSIQKALRRLVLKKNFASIEIARARFAALSCRVAGAEVCRKFPAIGKSFV